MNEKRIYGDGHDQLDVGSAFNSIAKGLGYIVNVLQEMLDRGEDEFVRRGKFSVGSTRQEISGVYGFSIKLGEQHLVKAQGKINSGSNAIITREEGSTRLGTLE